MGWLSSLKIFQILCLFEVEDSLVCQPLSLWFMMSIERNLLHKIINCQAIQTNRQTLSVYNFFLASCVISHFSVASSHTALITQEHKSPVRLNSFANIAPPPRRDIIGLGNSHRIQCSHKTI